MLISTYLINFVEISAKMAKSELIALISTLNKKIETLLNQQQRVLVQNKKLEEEMKELKQQHLADTEALIEANKKIEFLSLSHRLADNPEALAAARRKVSKLLGTIDNCIRLIKEN